LDDAKENYLEIKRLKRVFLDLQESFSLQKNEGSGKGKMNFYQKDLLQKQGRMT